MPKPIKYYYLTHDDNVRWTMWLDRDEDYGRADRGNYYSRYDIARDSLEISKAIRRSFYGNSNRSRIGSARRRITIRVD